ncbi:MAG: aromatic ring-hydroxylating dioxygenase subunit alpha [Pseudomonadota bacterium]
MSLPNRPPGFQGYYRQPIGSEDPELTHVLPGTPCGEYLRRYWQPVAMTAELGELPLLVKILGEELVLFRDQANRVGLLHRHCAHRGASLEYGIPAERGIVCCYHGWHFDIDGTIIRAGSEPENSPICKRVVQGAYPVRERNGLLFAYLGPPELTPELPTFDTEYMPGTVSKPFSIMTPCNWLQVYENTQDPIHVLHLHARSSGVQFGAASGVDQVIDYRRTPLGMFNVQTRHIGARLWTRTTDSILPNGNQTGAIWEEADTDKSFQRVAILRWMVPVDNTHTITIGWRFFSTALDPQGKDRPDEVGKESIDFVGQTAVERSYEESQRFPGDYEAQVSQRPIAIHALENRASSDAGVARLRALLREHVRALEAGNEPPQPDYHGLPHVPTYCQDTVTPWTHDDAPSLETMREHGLRVADVILESDRLSQAERERFIWDRVTGEPA